MQYYFSFTVILVLLYQCLASDNIDQVPDNYTNNAVEELLKKINDISDQTFASSAYGEKLNMLKKVEEKLKKAAKSLGNKGERYVQLIMKGLKSKALNEISDNSRSQMKIPNNIEDVSMLNNKMKRMNNNRITRTSSESPGNIKNKEDVSTKPEGRILKSEHNSENLRRNAYFLLKKNLRRTYEVSRESLEKYRRKNSLKHETSTEPIIESLTPKYGCQRSLDKICLDIKEMRQLKCHYDDLVIPIEKLCDGLTDCTGRTDEKYCTSQVTERIQNVNQILSKIDESFQQGCFRNKSKDSVMTTQIIILRSVLRAQQEFVQKYKYFNQSLLPNIDPFTREGTVKKGVNEISLIISSLSLALDVDLCSQRIEAAEEFIARKFNDLLVEDFDKIMDEVEWPPKSCVCQRERCKNSNCTNSCKRICWQKYSLTQFACQSVNDTEGIPLSVLCDGKFDCLDQSDEKDCVSGMSYSKYEAHKIFKEILSSLSIKVASKEYAFIRNMLLSLHNTIEELQKNCMAIEPDLKVIRALRNKLFSTLTSIYSETLTKTSYLYQKSEVYVFLLFLNNNIIHAMKRSHTGNKRLISNNGCFCRNGRCSMAVCSRNCVRSCIAEPLLTRYICEDTLNKSVSLDAICNGKPNCPKEDDEAHCQKEVCRRHHLLVLRHSLQKIGKKQQGTSMGELLATWKVKVSSTLAVAEDSYRPTPYTIRDTIKDILNDLVITYGALEDYRRDNEYALQEFTDIARYIMTFLKSCGS